MKKKLFISVVAVALVACFAIGGTLAWLTDTTDPVTNTFTVGDIDITLTESEDLNLKMVPGHTIFKDPKVSVDAGSEDCYLFVKVEESENFDDFMTYETAADWTKLENETGVYYRVVKNSDTPREFYVLADNQVTVKGEVTKEMLNDLTEGTYPTLTFTAYAVQYMKDDKTNFEPAEAWAQVKPATP